MRDLIHESEGKVPKGIDVDFRHATMVVPHATPCMFRIDAQCLTNKPTDHIGMTYNNTVTIANPHGGLLGIKHLCKLGHFGVTQLDGRSTKIFGTIVVECVC